MSVLVRRIQNGYVRYIHYVHPLYNHANSLNVRSRLGKFTANRHFPNLLESAQNNSLKLRRAMLTATKQWFTLPVLISCYCFVCTRANSGSVYCSLNNVLISSVCMLCLEYNNVSIVYFLPLPFSVARLYIILKWTRRVARLLIKQKWLLVLCYLLSFIVINQLITEPVRLVVSCGTQWYLTNEGTISMFFFMSVKIYETQLITKIFNDVWWKKLRALRIKPQDKTVDIFIVQS